MKTAIIYVSKHGTTEKVVRKIAEKLGSHEISFFNLKTDKNPDITPFDGIILGTPIYAGTSSKRMQTFIKNHAETLTTKRIGLFVCGMELNREKQQQELENAYPLSLKEQAITKHFLGGEFLFEKMNFFERAVIKRIAKTDKSVSRIDEDGIGKFVIEFYRQNINRPTRTQKMKKALVIIDIQNDITKKYKEIIGNINKAIDWAVHNDIHVVYIRHENLLPCTRTFKPNTQGAELVSDMKIVSKNVFTKYKGNALSSKDFADFVNENQIDEFYITGADAVACVKSTCFNMTKANFKVNVLADCITCYDKKKIEEMIHYYESKGCKIIGLNDLL